MAWYGLVNPATGDLVSAGTEAMFADGVVPDAGVQYQGFDVISFGATGPDWATLIWDAPTRTVKPRPVPVIISRLDDIEAWLLSDPDWATAWNNLGTARKNQIRTGLRRILARVLGPQQFRNESDTVEL